MKKTSFCIKVLVLTLVMGLLGPSFSLLAVNPQKERELGQRLHVKIAASGALFNDQIVKQYYNRITERIMRGAGLKPDQYKFYIINSNGINAFAVPGGYIYMHTETIISLENEGELASIVGHETAHLTARHFARRVEASSSLSMATVATMLVGVLVASSGGDSAGALGQALIFGGSGATISAMLANSREDEAEADAKGRQYLIKAGYNPKDMYGAFKTLYNKTYQLTNANVPTYMKTHPELQSRLAGTFKDYETQASSPVDPTYQAFRDRVLALSGESRRVSTIMTNRLNKNPGDASALHALGLLAAREQKLSQADQLFQKALAISPGNPEYLSDLGDLNLRRRKPKEARDCYEKAGRDNRQAVLGLARSYELLGDSSKAATAYDRAINMDTEPFPEAYELAGRFFGRSQRGKGHYYLARYFVETGNLKQAAFHLKEVAKTSDGGPFKAHAARDLVTVEDLLNDGKSKPPPKEEKSDTDNKKGKKDFQRSEYLGRQAGGRTL